MFNLFLLFISSFCLELVLFDGFLLPTVNDLESARAKTKFAELSDKEVGALVFYFFHLMPLVSKDWGPSLIRAKSFQRLITIEHFKKRVNASDEAYLLLMFHHYEAIWVSNINGVKDKAAKMKEDAAKIAASAAAGDNDADARWLDMAFRARSRKRGPKDVSNIVAQVEKYNEYFLKSQTWLANDGFADCLKGLQKVYFGLAPDAVDPEDMQDEQFTQRCRAKKTVRVLVVAD